MPYVIGFSEGLQVKLRKLQIGQTKNDIKNKKTTNGELHI